jgi:hypothetical protein
MYLRISDIIDDKNQMYNIAVQQQKYFNNSS